MTEILYKYKSLDNFKNFVDIILKNRLYAAPYKDLNDPMEGQYYYRTGELDRNIRSKLTEEKGMLRLCSLSRVNNNELMWSHYTNGQRGVAIGLKINNEKYTVKPIIYNGLASIEKQNYNEQTAIEILSHKLEVWSYEREERVFIKDKHFVDIEIVEIILGRVMSNSDISFMKELISKLNPNIKIIRAHEVMKD